MQSFMPSFLPAAYDESAVYARHTIGISTSSCTCAQHVCVCALRSKRFIIDHEMEKREEKEDVRIHTNNNNVNIRLANGQLVCIAHMPYISPERLKYNKFMLASLHLFRPAHI